RRRLPLHVDQPRDLLLVEDRRARPEVDRHALAAGDEADDRVARDRMAALGEPDEEIADALDPDAAGPRGQGRGRHRRQADLGAVEDPELGDHLLRADRAVTDRGVEVLERVVVVALADLGDPLEADRLDRLAGQPPELALQGLTAVDDVLVAVLPLEPLADL